MTSYMLRRDRGVTLTELLVVMLIVGLLSSIAVPVYIQRQETAKIRMAEAESRQIAEAEDTCQLLHGYYVPFQILDDHPDNPNTAGNTEEISNEPRSNIWVINPLIRPEEQVGRQPSLADEGTGRIRDMVDRWQGPFMTFHRFYIGTYPDPNDPGYINSGFLFLDFPLDPWGQPYRFYSPLGIIGSNALQTDLRGIGVQFSNGVLTTIDDRNFDRYAVVSFGRNGESDTQMTGLQYRDDVVYLFGMAGVESTFGLRM